MYIVEKNSELNISMDIFEKYRMDSTSYFDIETTGFDKIENTIILISLGWFTNINNFHVKQYYADKITEEKKILESFKNDIVKFNSWCSYNGKAFDEPFIEARMLKNDIAFEAPLKHIDLYRLIRPYYKQLGMSRCNLKSVEKYAGVDRKDKIDGGLSVELYYQYLESQDEEIKRVIMLHNFEDVLNLPKLFKVIFKIDSNSEFVRADCITEKQLKYLKFLLHKNNINLDIIIEKMSKKAASKVIDSLLKGNVEQEQLQEIAASSY